MSNKVISVEDLSKAYRLGQFSTGTLTYDLKVWWAKVRGKPNPVLRIGREDHSDRAGEIIWALKDINFSIEQGEVLGIIGRNGSGKSTLLKILSSVTAPTLGLAKLKGQIASLLEVGTGFHPDLTGRENTYLNGAILGMSKQEVHRKFEEIVEFSGIKQFIDTPVKRYSSGMHVRLGFAVAAHLDSEILIVDEVLAVGDAEFQKKCLDKMEDVAKDGRTVLLVSHNTDTISRLCTRTILLENGGIIEDGNSYEIVSKYQQRYAPSQVDINTVHRSGNGLARFVSVRVLDEQGQSSQVFRMGETIIVEMEAISNVKSGLEFSVVISNHPGNPIIYALDRENNFDAVWDSGHYRVRISFSNIMLYPGRYIIGVNCGNGRSDYDHIKEFAYITIKPGEVLPGRLTTRSEGRAVFYSPSKWENL